METITKMNVQNMQSGRGNDVPNQFIITGISAGKTIEVFKSYQSIIAIKTYDVGTKTQIDINKWDFSNTTGKYRNQFLGESKAETQKKIDSGEYVLANLN